MLDVETVKRAIEGRDAQTLSNLYAEDAALIVMDRDHMPSSPQTISGQKAISAYYADICGRDMQHELVAGISNDAHLAFTEACTYPDGTRVFCSAMAEVLDGKIKRQTNVQVWDS
jgi:ketosteroid isomerase-like protein